MKRSLLFLCLLSGCTALMSHEPVTQSAQFAASPETCYRRATQAMAQMGGQVTASDATTRMLSAQVHNAVTLTVLVAPTATGCTVAATGTLLPNKIAVGSLTEVQDYLALVEATHAQ